MSHLTFCITLDRKQIQIKEQLFKGRAFSNVATDYRFQPVESRVVSSRRRFFVDADADAEELEMPWPLSIIYVSDLPLQLVKATVTVLTLAPWKSQQPIGLLAFNVWLPKEPITSFFMAKSL